VNSIRLSVLLLFCACLTGCQELALTPQQPVASKRTLVKETVETRDEDSFSSRMAIAGKSAKDAAAKPLKASTWKADPNSPAERQRQAAIRRKQKEPNAFMRWMFPEPTPPRTVGEWLAQERLDP